MGRARYPWFKVWYEILEDPKMKRLSNAEFGIFIKILAIAGRSPVRGKLLIAEGIPYTLDDIARDTLCYSDEDRENLDSTLAKLNDMNVLSWKENKCLEVVHWQERQEIYPSQLPEGRLKAAKRKKASPDREEA
jgi:hypothetical protein